jgi:hypothetical protein
MVETWQAELSERRTPEPTGTHAHG